MNSLEHAQTDDSANERERKDIGCLPLGQAFQTNSFTRPTVISGSKDIVRLLPETSKNVKETCGVCGTTMASLVVLSTWACSTPAGVTGGIALLALLV